MNNNLLFIIILTAAFTISAVISEKPVQGESVFLNDGSIAEGTIISDSPGSLTLRGADKKLRQIRRGDIKRILYTKLRMAKVFIQKRDGKSAVAFIVDEDQESYTCRNELYSPEEFTLKRSDVLFMAEKNPSGLQYEGEIGTDTVRLTWLAPYGEVRKYNVYLKKGENSKYELTESSKGKSVTLKNLSSNTTYFIVVTSVDTTDYESTPSNELKIKTANLRPEKPNILSAEKNPLDGTITYRWNISSDPDGKVVKYRIYGTKNKKRETVSEEKGDVYTLKNPESYNKLELTAVDDLGDESRPAELPLMKNRYTFSLYPEVIIPLGKFGDVAGTGYGVTAELKHNNYTGLVLGIEGGFYDFTEKDSTYKKTDTSYMASFLFTAGYCFKTNQNINVTPYMGFGAAWFYSDYINRDNVTLNENEETLSEAGPLMCAGVAGSYRLTESFSMVLRLYTGYLAGADSGLYAGFGLGCMYSL